MTHRSFSFPEIGVIAATRGLAGAGVGLLLSDRLGRQQRRALGWTLFAVGVASTIPLLWYVLRKSPIAEQRELAREPIMID